MDMKTSIGGNTSIPDNKPNDAMIKDGTVIVNPCSICGLGGYVISSGGKSYFVPLISLKSWPIAPWISSNSEDRQVQVTMIESRHFCSPSGTATIGPSKPK